MTRTFDSTEAAPTNRFEYTPLPYSDSTPPIRLVELLPGKGLAEIECRLRPTSLNPLFPTPQGAQSRLDGECETSTSSYEALSYCWGDMSVRTPIKVNGAVLAVTTNLKAALHHLRCEESARTIWIDAICINQNDNKERSQQVGIMREIYRQASRTVVWLGEAVDDSDLAFSFCRRLAAEYWSGDYTLQKPTHSVVLVPRMGQHDQKMHSLTVLNGGIRSRTQSEPLVDLDVNTASLASGVDKVALSTRHTSSQPEEDLSKPKLEEYVGPPSVESSKLELLAFHRLIKRPWFKRMWIAQEIGMAEEAVMMCGENSIDWNDLQIAFNLSLLTGRSTIEGRPDYIQNGILQLLLLRRDLALEDESELSLLKLLIKFRAHDATDPRDKVFALYGLTSTRFEFLKLRADYLLDVKDVYKAVTRAQLEHSRNLKILSIPHGGSNSGFDLPSWVPDWSNSGSHAPLFDRDECTFFGTFSEPQFKASGTSQLPSLAVIDEAMLSLPGYIVDEISELGAALNMPSFDFVQRNAIFTGLAQQIKWWAKLALGVCDSLVVYCEWEEIARRNENGKLLIGEDHTTAFVRTLCAEWFPLGQEAALQEFPSGEGVSPASD